MREIFGTKFQIWEVFSKVSQKKNLFVLFRPNERVWSEFFVLSLIALKLVEMKLQGVM